MATFVKALLCVLAWLTITQCSAAIPKAPVKKMDITVAIQYSKNDPALAGDLKRSVVNLFKLDYKDYMSPEDLDEARLAFVVYSCESTIVFDFSDGYNLVNIADWEADFLATPLPVPCNNNQKELGAAIADVITIFNESEPIASKAATFITDGENTGSRRYFYDVVRKLNEEDRHIAISVIGLDVHDGLHKRDIYTRAAQQSNIQRLTNYDMSVFTQVTNGAELVTTSSSDVYRERVNNRLYIMECDTDSYACHRTCGVGWMAVNSECNIFRGNRIVARNIKYFFMGRCCHQPYPVTGTGVATRWKCRNLPPANGHMN